MALFAKIKCFLASFLLFYTIYLYNYKCVELKETSFEHATETVFHPLTHHHNQLCESLEIGTNFIQPYVVKVQGFLDEHVHSHPLFKQYEIHEKIVAGQDAFGQYVYPYVYQVFQAVDAAEVVIYDQATEHYATLKALYEEHFGSK
ncbi:uncharacterized protein RJT21DRAFT_137472 [Scheffersomyces amazonensis]|uniref:uncharacterized protein n=1 Tax=Scheffersomyces amazonensis TaxID=1078765 RepID=UPI00315D40E5